MSIKVLKQNLLKRCLSYARVSTFGQVENDDGTRRDDASPEAQRKRCLSHCKFLEEKTGIPHVIVQHFCDEACSGKNTKRPQYQEMWRMISSGHVDIIITTELSRLSRSVTDFLELIRHCEDHDVQLIIIGLDLDTSTPHGRMMVTVLVALAQFEREMTSMRVRENARSRLITDGKINGSAEILGLDKDPKRKGHFIPNPDELQTVERLLQLYLQLSSKEKLLQTAKEQGLTNKRGRPLKQHALDIVFTNVRWRYRGLWYANRENQDHPNPELLPESKRYQIVKLPHGPLIDDDLLNKVQAKIDDTKVNRKKTGRDDYVYLLSRILFHEDGSRFTGESAKEGNYRYYYNAKHKMRTMCEDIDKLVLKRVKDYLCDSAVFKKLAETAIKQSQTELQKVDKEISDMKAELEKNDQAEDDLKKDLMDPEKRRSEKFMHWLEDEALPSIEAKNKRLTVDLENKRIYRENLIRSSGLEKLQEVVREMVGKLDKLTGTEKRNFIERIIMSVTLRPGNVLELKVNSEPPSRVTALRNHFSGSSLNGGSDGTRTHGLRRDRATL